jgi:hypothetical protein
VPEESALVLVTFIVRTAREADGRLRGTVERVRTGEKQRFTGADGIGGIIDRMLRLEASHRRRGRRPQEET